MDNVETQQLDIRSVPDPESPDKALPADSAAPKKLKDTRRLRRKVSPPSTPTTTASPPSKKDEEDLAFTPEGKVNAEHKILMKTDQAEGKRGRKAPTKNVADDRKAGHKADAGDDEATASAEKRGRAPGKRRRILKAKLKNTKTREDLSDSPASKSSKKDDQASPASTTKAKGKAKRSTDDHASPASTTKAKGKAKRSTDDHASPASTTKAKGKAKPTTDDHASPASTTKKSKAAKAEPETESATKKRKSSPASKSSAPAEDTVAAGGKPKPKAKAKSRAKDSEPKSSNKGKGKAKAASEGDGAPAKTPKPKGKAKAKAGSLRPVVSKDKEADIDEYMMDRFHAYGRQCYSQEGEEGGFDLETRKRLRSCLSSFENTNLIIYWTRPAVALKFKKHERNKDFFYNAFPCPENVCYRIHMLVSIQVGIEMAEYLDHLLDLEPLEKMEGFAEKGVAVLLEDPEVTAHYEMVLLHGRKAMEDLLEDSEIEE
ncbi:unnamed protein product [Symbiodinium microadriaticum]|nr:unnamed protein product [Symbiodinium microadriaticum]